MPPHDTKFKPGQSGNPGGRPKGIERRVRELLKDDWDAIIMAMADIALGKLPPGITGETTVKIRDRVDAAKLVLDRGWGKARTVVDVNADIIDGALGAVDVNELDEASLAMLEDTISRLRDRRGPSSVIDAKSTTIVPAIAASVELHPRVEPKEAELQPMPAIDPLAT